jgi:prephenate dehydrogenase
MEEDGFLSASRVALWGLGLMGGSLAMALKGKCASIVGIDTDPQAVSLAQEWGIIERGSTRPEDLLPTTDLVILATPVRVILSQLAQLPSLHPGHAVVMDIGSTKQAVMAAMAALPPRFDPLGGHPMCGKEKSSLRHAEASVYRNAPFALTSLPNTSRRAQQLGEALVNAVEARPLWMEADQHDRWVAATSHLPYLLSSALVRATPMEAAPLVGSGFRSSSRLAGSSTRMMADILATNRDNIREAIARFRLELDRYDALLENDSLDEMVELMEEGVGRVQKLCV